MTENENTPLTARTLRKALFFLADQKMTAEQIRAMLCTVEDQDAPIDPGFSMWLKMENQFAISERNAQELVEVTA